MFLLVNGSCSLGTKVLIYANKKFRKNVRDFPIVGKVSSFALNFFNIYLDWIAPIACMVGCFSIVLIISGIVTFISGGAVNPKSIEKAYLSMSLLQKKFCVSISLFGIYIFIEMFGAGIFLLFSLILFLIYDPLNLFSKDAPMTEQILRRLLMFF